MSVGIWVDDETGEIGSDFGVVDYPRARPDRGEVGHLILVNKEWADGNCAEDYEPFPTSITEVDGRRFFNVELGDRTWTWELFDTHYADYDEVCRVYIGRWPD